MTGRALLIFAVMEQIDKLFKQNTGEQEILGRAPATLRGYQHSFQWFRKLMPDVTIESINGERIIEFIEKLSKI